VTEPRALAERDGNGGTRRCWLVWFWSTAGRSLIMSSQTRVVLIDRYSVLTEETVEVFAETNKFRRLPDDNVATNPAVRFLVETFEPSEGFQPRKPYQSRLKWRDQDGNDQSKLLLTKPETVIAVVLRGKAPPAPERPRDRRRIAPSCVNRQVRCNNLCFCNVAFEHLNLKSARMALSYHTYSGCRRRRLSGRWPRSSRPRPP
jgi:hypothetical protein